MSTLNKKMMAIIIIEAVQINGSKYFPSEPGEDPNVIELEFHEARQIIHSRKAIEYVDPEVAIESDQGEPSERQAQLMAAIETLDPETDFTKDGLPKVEALEVLLGGDVTSAERDQAWNAMEEAEE